MNDPRFTVERIPGKGRGLIARRAFEPGDLVVGPDHCEIFALEEAMPMGIAIHSGHTPGGSRYVSYGPGALLNHGDPANVLVDVDDETWTVRVYAIRHIEPGDEITLWYGEAPAFPLDYDALIPAVEEPEPQIHDLVEIHPFRVPLWMCRAFTSTPVEMHQTDDDRLSGWANHTDPWVVVARARMTRIANDYALRRMGTVAANATDVFYMAYGPGHWCGEHIDQYERESGETIDRTVSASLILQAAGDGGAMVFQDHGRERDYISVNPPGGSLVLFPGDWWHSVQIVKKGMRIAATAWWNDGGSGERFRSADRRLD